VRSQGRAIGVGSITSVEGKCGLVIEAGVAARGLRGRAPTAGASSRGVSSGRATRTAVGLDQAITGHYSRLTVLTHQLGGEARA
jgi:hypothetical protein